MERDINPRFDIACIVRRRLNRWRCRSNSAAYLFLSVELNVSCLSYIVFAKSKVHNDNEDESDY